MEVSGLATHLFNFQSQHLLSSCSCKRLCSLAGDVDLEGEADLELAVNGEAAGDDAELDDDDWDLDEEEESKDGKAV